MDDIPDRISDMDSVPGTLSLDSMTPEDTAELCRHVLIDAAAAFARQMEAFGASCRQAARGLTGRPVSADSPERPHPLRHSAGCHFPSDGV